MQVWRPLLLGHRFLQFQLLPFPHLGIPEWCAGVYDTGRHLLERRWRRPLYTHDRPNTASYRCLLGPFANPYIGTYDYPLKAP